MPGIPRSLQDTGFLKGLNKFRAMRESNLKNNNNYNKKNIYIKMQ